MHGFARFRPFGPADGSFGQPVQFKEQPRLCRVTSRGPTHGVVDILPFSAFRCQRCAASRTRSIHNILHSHCKILRGYFRWNDLPPFQHQIHQICASFPSCSKIRHRNRNRAQIGLLVADPEFLWAFCALPLCHKKFGSGRSYSSWRELPDV